MKTLCAKGWGGRAVGGGKTVLSGKATMHSESEEEYSWGEHDCALITAHTLADTWFTKEEDEAWEQVRPK